MSTFRIETIDGSAEANKDYIPIKETITFEPEETLKQIEIVIIDDNEWEPDEVFFVKLSLDPDDSTTVLGKKTIQEITILNDDGQSRRYLASNARVICSIGWVSKKLMALDHM